MPPKLSLNVSYHLDYLFQHLSFLTLVQVAYSKSVTVTGDVLLGAGSSVTDGVFNYDVPR